MVKVLALLLLALPCMQVSAEEFPRPEGLESAVSFWTKVYTEISTDQGYLHDDEHLAIVYSVLTLPDARQSSAREAQIHAAQAEIEDALRNLGEGKRSDLAPIEEQVLAAWPQDSSSRQFAEAAARVRFQLGQADRFRRGLVRSGQWKSHIREVLAKYGLPAELEALPHVESSFMASAWSKAGAAGMWQFMPTTGRHYMRVDHIVDERMDPFIATDGAARLLATNYRLTGTWPLALTSYNHGAAGMRRAAKTLGTTDIDVIVDKYKSRSFGFASRNFYASFLAAQEIDSNPEQYFPQIELARPVAYDTVRSDDFVSALGFAQEAGVELGELRRHNPALLDPVWKGEKHIPKGFPVRLPSSQLPRPLHESLASLSLAWRFGQQKPDKIYRVAQGDSLSTIAQRYNTTVAKLKAVNGLRSHKIRTGKTLILPGSVEEFSLSAAQVAATRARLEGKTVEYVIQRGDSLWSIARQFNVSTQDLVVWNNLSAKAYLQPGQKLKIAGAG
ncbi:MAG: LysM peptidoglycan-binding domain-containing protein [Halioglobus sp.]|nr:LysM peptidoglycan-binding domain-containing protein [Halioglobus sp.]